MESEPRLKREGNTCIVYRKKGDLRLFLNIGCMASIRNEQNRRQEENVFNERKYGKLN
jgi:hypothetical protein